MAILILALTARCVEAESPVSPPGPTPTSGLKRAYTPKPFPTLAPTPTPTPLKQIILNFNARIEERLAEGGEREHCRLSDDIKTTLRSWYAESLTYLRAYYDAPYFSENDRDVVIYYLERERGRQARLCADAD